MTFYGPVTTGLADFGPIVTGSDVEDWCLQLCRRWAGTYLSEVERQHGLTAGHWQRPRSFVRTIAFETYPEDQVPRVMVISTGVGAPPTREGDGAYTARWLVALAVVCSAATQDDAHLMARHYVAALRTLFLQRPGLDGHANGTDWLDERYDDLATDDQRSLSSGQAHFSVEVASVGNDMMGPVTPDQPFPDDTQPWPPYQDVETVEIAVTNTPVDQ